MADDVDMQSVVEEVSNFFPYGKVRMPQSESTHKSTSPAFTNLLRYMYTSMIIKTCVKY